MGEVCERDGGARSHSASVLSDLVHCSCRCRVGFWRVWCIQCNKISYDDLVSLEMTIKPSILSALHSLYRWYGQLPSRGNVLLGASANCFPQIDASLHPSAQVASVANMGHPITPLLFSTAACNANLSHSSLRVFASPIFKLLS